MLREGAHFRVEAMLPPDEPVEITYHGDNASVWAQQYWGTRVFNRAGYELRL